MQRPAQSQHHRETRLDAYVDRYAARSREMSASQIRALFSVASRPEVVSLAGGMPNISGLPLDIVGATLRDLVVDDGTAAMQYSSGQGDPALREQICDVMRLEGIHGHADDVVVTVGSQQAVDLVTRIFCDPGDVVLRSPLLRGRVGRLPRLPVRRRSRRDGRRRPAAGSVADGDRSGAGGREAPKFLYTVPSYHNPAGVSLSVGRRAEVLQVCRQADLLVVEDNPYGLLGFDEEPYRALRADDAEDVVYLGRSPRRSRRVFGSAGRWRHRRSGRSWCWPRSRRRSARPPSASSPCPPICPGTTGSVRSRRSARCTRSGETRCSTRSASGCLPARSGRCRRRLLRLADVARGPGQPGDAAPGRDRPGGVRTGSAFYADGSGARAMRLSYCFPTPERIREGVRRLATVVEQELELYETFGAAGPASIPGIRVPQHRSAMRARR